MSPDPVAGAVYGAGRDLECAVGTHLFIICPNNSGSTFLQQALATCRATWNLPREGQKMPGFVGDGRPPGGMVFAAEQRWMDALTDATAYDWPRTRRAWYFQAFARDAQASVFVVKTPAFLLYADALARHFRHTKFLFMVRNPYAVCEGICRKLRTARRAPGAGADPAQAAARHVVACLGKQRRNVEAHRERGVFFTYEAMCDEPARVERDVRALVPELTDLKLRQSLPVKGAYHEMLVNMNARQIARLGAAEIAAFNRVFREHREVLDYFGYEVMEGAG